MSDSESEKTVIDEEASNVFVVDPEDYRKTKKLQAIQDSKEHFRDLRRNRAEYEHELKEKYTNNREAYEGIKAEAIADYASELVPLIEAGLEKGALSEDDLIANSDKKQMSVNVIEVAEERGRMWNGDEVIPLLDTLCGEVYRQLERIERKLGLGLELEENKDPAEI